MNRCAALALLLAVAGALALRLPHLDSRPLHNDEGVNAVKLAALWERGEYKYDPDEFHGPSLYYFSLPYLRANSARNADELDATRLRLVTVAFGVGLIFLLPLLRDGLGNTATAFAAVFIAVSPAMVFYSRYFIHEMLLVFFTLLTLAAGWRYWKSRQAGWAVVGGAGFGLMFATKETFVLSAFAMAVAAVATIAWSRWWINHTAPARSDSASGTAFSQAIASVSWRQFLNGKHIALALLVPAVVWLVLFSSFFSNWNGLQDSIRTYLPWAHRAGGASPHNHPWDFYFNRLVWSHPPKSPIWSEALILVLAFVGAVMSFGSNRAIVTSPALARFLTFYTLTLTVIYSAISYKTPWCLLNFWIGMILLAGIGAAALLRLWRRKLTQAIIVVGLAAASYDLAAQAILASQDFAASRKNPYAYAQTTTNLLTMVKRIEAIARVAPAGHKTVVKIIAPDSYGPLPWYLRRFKNTGWWEQLPEDPYAPLIIVSPKLEAKLDEKSNGAYVMTGFYELHPGSFVELYVERELWGKFIATLPRDRD